MNYRSRKQVADSSGPLQVGLGRILAAYTRMALAVGCAGTVDVGARGLTGEQLY